MVIFHSYVKLPEGNHVGLTYVSCHENGWIIQKINPHQNPTGLCWIFTTIVTLAYS